MDGNANYESGLVIGEIFRYITIVAIILCVILYLAKQYKIVSIIKTIFAWIFMIYGAFMVLVFVGNIFFSVYLPYMMIIGAVFFIVGFFLKRWKIKSVTAH